MSNTVLVKEVLKFLTSENSSIICDDSLRKSMCRKYCSHNFSIVAVDVAAETGTTSNHFECASTSTRNILFRNGPA